MYFNIANPINLPSPIMFSRKLAKFIAERSKVVKTDYMQDVDLLGDASEQKVKLIQCKYTLHSKAINRIYSSFEEIQFEKTITF